MHIQQISIRLAFLATSISILIPASTFAKAESTATPHNPNKTQKPFPAVSMAAPAIVSPATIPTTSATPITPATPTTPAKATATAPTTDPAAAPRVLAKPGDTLSITTTSDDLNPTDDLNIAREQVKAYPNSPEAHFILAVALTRTSNVEEAIQEVRRAKKLAYAQGGSEYFDKTIAKYESMLTYLPEDDKVRYGLAWAYYMKAYLIAQQSKDMQKAIALKAQQEGKSLAPDASLIDKATKDPNSMRVKGALELAHPDYVPYIRKYYELSLGKLDELISRQPGDTWAKVYRAFVKAEYTGNVEEAMNTWLACRAESPNNPSPYFFLAEGYLKQGNLKESLSNISKAVALRAQGY
jgi:hypothetical protein